MDMAPTTKTSFWQRMGLDEGCRDVCITRTREVFRGYEVEEFGQQGYCSYTLLVSPSFPSPDRDSVSLNQSNGVGREKSKRIVQFRPRQHTLDLSVNGAAREVYGSLVPEIHKLDLDTTETTALEVFEMNMVPGTPYSRTQIRRRELDDRELRRQVRLVEELAAFVARGWSGSNAVPHSALRDEAALGANEVFETVRYIQREHQKFEGEKRRETRADSPMSETFTIPHCTPTKQPYFLSQCTGKVGSKTLQKLDKLSQDLPDTALRRRASETLSLLLEVDNEWPVVLNHGDLIPSNILVDAEAGAIQGVVDWAEAEWLPFGTCLYALEHFLGYLESATPCGSAPTWRYYTHAPFLRARFHEKLLQYASGLAHRGSEIGAMRDLGVLLWYGYAWDDGRIDRVVNEEDDAAEVECLRAFLGTDSLWCTASG